MSNQKMATSREVYNRILWDARLDRHAFTIGYLERTSEVKLRSKPLAEWEANGDIPWHRIRYISCGETIVWDRDRHLDLVSIGQLPAAAWTAQLGEQDLPLIATPFSPKPIYRYGSQGWQPSDELPESVPSSALTIVSFNVLCDTYEQERIQTEKRIPAIASHLRNCDADIIALQEVTRSLLDNLLELDWVRGYFISEPPEASTLERYGLLILSRLPFTLVEHRYSAHKQVLVGTWQINERSLHVAVVHLTSNRGHNAMEKRAVQLNLLLDYLKTQPGDCAIAGDFNTRGDEQQDLLTKSGFVDVWKELHPLEEGYTFDPHRNTLAAIMTISNEAARFDRILLRAADGRWLPRSMEIFACEPIPEAEGTLYASDHFGVRAVLECSMQTTASLRAVRPVYQSAVVVIPPAEVWSAIQAIRRRYDRQIDRWMPHITLIYGFVPEEYFEEAAQAIARSLAVVEPFEITLSGFDTFEHRSSSTAWLRPVTQPERALHQLQAVLQQLFPQCDEQSKKSPAGFTPHLSVGQFKSVQEAIAQLPSWHPISFPVESVALISRRGDEPFEVRYLVPLGKEIKDTALIAGTGESFTQNPKLNSLIQLVSNLEPELSQAQREHRETILSLVAQAIAECLGYQPSLHLVGSARLGVQSPQSDLDVVCLIPTYMSGEQFLLSVRERLSGLCDRSQVVKDARMPALRMQIEGVSVDLLYACTPNDFQLENPKSKIQNRVNDFDPLSWKALVGCLEADAIADTVIPRIPLDSFRVLLRATRAWAKARQIHGNAWGFVGNFSIALLTAWSCANYPQNVEDAGIERLLQHFFQALAEHDWSYPIALTEAGRHYNVRLPRDWMPIVTSIEPCQNSARNVSRSTAEILRREFVRGAEIVERALAGEIGWEMLFESADLKAQSSLFLVLSATIEDSDRSLSACGWLEGRIIGLAINLEQQIDVCVRPWPGIRKDQNKISAILGLELPKDCDRVSWLEANGAVIQLLAQNFVSQFNNSFADSNSIALVSLLCDRQDFGQLYPNL
ncbi:DUF504 domain-containing protein [Microcoleus sp. FACHB-831]|uniref:poly(A) polymerase n=1 Tax=Microcoleus sp. FACHB-831 TaxID=2692827 RepID=UPI001689AE69|nr:poly(A) polymerase [Microcoleus sp. FACHB-831]MBD1920305.1 DUF504 domain-containing protein [Microcoleus sp. FACHB-831]